MNIVDNAKVLGDAKVYGYARVYGDSRVYGNAQVSGNAEVYGYARVSGYAEVFGNAEVYGAAWVFGNARVFGDAWVSGYAKVYDYAKVCAKLTQGVICGDMVWDRKLPQVKRSDGYVFTYCRCSDRVFRVSAGCRYFTLEEARNHWTSTRGGTKLGEETLSILDFLESQVSKYYTEGTKL